MVIYLLNKPKELCIVQANLFIPFRTLAELNINKILKSKGKNKFMELFYC